MITELQTFGPFPHGITRDFKRADLEFYSCDHFRPTFTAWIFFNDGDVDEKNADPKRPSFAGTIAVFGHSDCWGTGGHCSNSTTARRFDLRPSHALTPAFRRAIVTRALRAAVKESTDLTISVVATTREPWNRPEGARLLSFSGLQLVTFA